MPNRHEVTTQSAQAGTLDAFPETSWNILHEPGAYIERGTGDLYRFPKESLVSGASPTIVKESNGTSVLIKISDDPFITSFQAKVLAAQHNIQPNF